MASLIKLKQIESGSALQTAAGAGADFSASVISIISSSVVGVLPDGIISGSSQLNGTTINNLTLSTTGDAYSLIVSGAVAIVDTEINISGTLYNVPGELWINGETGSAGNAPINPYDNDGNAEADIIDNGEW